MKQIKNSDFNSQIFDIKTETQIKKTLVIIDFYADWCQPCKTMEKILSEIEKEYTDVEFVKVNAEEEFALAEYFEIRNLPTLIYLINGKKFSQSGLTNKQNIISKISEFRNAVIAA